MVTSFEIFQQTMKRKNTIICVILGGLLSLGAVSAVDVTLTGNYEGVFLLKGRQGALLELKDDVFLNEGQRYIVGIDLEKIKQLMHSQAHASTQNAPHLYFEWNEKNGDGIVKNHLPGGRQLFTSFGRFIDNNGLKVSGLFVGGGLPSASREEAGSRLNETGMAYFNGVRWLHIWCTANEAMSSFSSFTPSYPSSWKFLGSRVLHEGEESLVLQSSHGIMNENEPLRMDRYAHFKAGETYFFLEIVIKNIGKKPTTFFYLYGDEPWLGEYGSSAGNVGWAEDGMHRFEGYLDAGKNHYAGFYDYGNDAVNEPHTFTRAANFIEWFGSERPSVYFANDVMFVPQKGRGAPLSSNERFLGLNWGPKTLEPNQSVTYILAVGMAGHDDRTDLPVIPEINPVNFP